MKQLVLIAAICTCIAIIACSSSRKNMQHPGIVELYGKEEQLTDTFLHRLQQENDVVLAAAIENTAWSKNTAYQIIARKNGIWRGYTYKVNAFARQPPQVGSVVVLQGACDIAVKFFEQPGIWKNKSDSERMSCNATINDGLTWHLLMITPAKVLRATYYEPQFYQDHCPGAGRQVFLDATNKIKEIFTGQ